jgi:hypothetical protein
MQTIDETCMFYKNVTEQLVACLQHYKINAHATIKTTLDMMEIVHNITDTY